MEQKTIIAIICLIAVAGLVIFLVYPKYQDLAFSRNQLDRKKQELSLQQNYFSQINTVLEKLNSYQDKLEKIDSALPEQVSLPELYNYFQKAPSESGLILNSLSVGKPEASSAVASTQAIEVSISAAGSYASLKNFLSNTYKSARLVELESVSFASGGGEGKGGKEIPSGLFEFNFKLRVHSYSPSVAGIQIETSAPAEIE